MHWPGPGVPDHCRIAFRYQENPDHRIMSSTIFMSSTMFRYSTIVVTKPHGLRFALGTAICALAALAMLVVAAHAQEREPDRAATLSTAAPMPAPVETSSPACR